MRTCFTVRLLRSNTSEVRIGWMRFSRALQWPRASQTAATRQWNDPEIAPIEGRNAADPMLRSLRSNQATSGLVDSYGFASLF